MRNTLVITLFSLALFATPATASVYSDDLTKCIVSKTTEADKKAVMRWMFAMMSANPDLSGMANVTEAQRVSYNQDAGKLFERLLLVDCRSTAKMAIQLDGPSSIATAFDYVGRVAVQGLMQNAAVQAYLGKLTETWNQGKWEEFMAEAGQPVRKPAP